MDLSLQGVSVTAGGRKLVEEITLEAQQGRFVGLVGPNGSGKSTTLRAAYHVLKPSAGAVLVDGRPVESMAPRVRARAIAAVAQESHAEFDFTVSEAVAMGRQPHHGLLDRITAGDRKVCEAALAQVGLTHLADRGVLTLSGGERQRVLIARALAQQPRILVLDEPTNHLDIRHQLEILTLARESGLTVLAALHDLNLAAAMCDTVYVLGDGRLVASGTPEQVLTPRLLADVFGVHAHVVRHPGTGRPQLLFELLDSQKDRHA
ncbi:ABC transporter ATP-binding protein [Amycolatopsis jiangsuensis]|uniref:Iron complex transport system ATP-binding protein n=1 Tax=Amycolatopsis jiangsuensis TaxID=1181879 RepID=A0A840IX80_9PSEU|nr:ABC transporter ATP-binding protein [Amycolatopsis jiangsuensis]MBB4685504.1 iron complex transport system ATP-binding protein [Amycolatopsis jiangsuensis]